MRAAGEVKGPWSRKEDLTLRRLVARMGAKNWSRLAAQEGLQGRTAKSCRLRWVNHLDPQVNKETFKEAENRVIVLGYAKHGPRWSLIAKQLQGRTDSAIKNHWNVTLKKEYTELLQKILLDPQESDIKAAAAFGVGTATVTSAIADHAQQSSVPKGPPRRVEGGRVPPLSPNADLPMCRWALSIATGAAHSSTVDPPLHSPSGLSLPLPLLPQGGGPWSLPQPSGGHFGMQGGGRGEEGVEGDGFSLEEKILALTGGGQKRKLGLWDTGGGMAYMEEGGSQRGSLGDNGIGSLMQRKQSFEVSQMADPGAMQAHSFLKPSSMARLERSGSSSLSCSSPTSMRPSSMGEGGGSGLHRGASAPPCSLNTELDAMVFDAGRLGGHESGLAAALHSGPLGGVGVGVGVGVGGMGLHRGLTGVGGGAAMGDMEGGSDGGGDHLNGFGEMRSFPRNGGGGGGGLLGDGRGREELLSDQELLANFMRLNGSFFGRGGPLSAMEAQMGGLPHHSNVSGLAPLDNGQGTGGLSVPIGDIPGFASLEGGHNPHLGGLSSNVSQMSGLAPYNMSLPGLHSPEGSSLPTFSRNRGPNPNLSRLSSNLAFFKNHAASLSRNDAAQVGASHLMGGDVSPLNQLDPQQLHAFSSLGSHSANLHASGGPILELSSLSRGSQWAHLMDPTLAHPKGPSPSTSLPFPSAQPAHSPPEFASYLEDRGPSSPLSLGLQVTAGASRLPPDRLRPRSASLSLSESLSLSRSQTTGGAMEGPPPPFPGGAATSSDGSSLLRFLANEWPSLDNRMPDPSAGEQGINGGASLDLSQ